MSYSELKTQKGNFRLLHGFEGKKISVSDIPAKFDAVLVEMVHHPPIEDLDKRAQAYLNGRLLSQQKQVRALQAIRARSQMRPKGG